MTVDIERLQVNNPWWKSPKEILGDPLIAEFETQKLRYLHPLLSSFPLKKDGVITIRGPRRVGKSTLFRLLIKKLLLEEKIPKEAVFSFPCDLLPTFDDLYEVVNSYLDYARPRTDSRLFLFLDEISFVTDWQRAIKELVDRRALKNALVCLTGSSILDLKFGSEYLSGRRGDISPADIFYYPLSFKEFVNLVKPDINTDETPFNLNYSLPVLHKLFSDFLITGGFPKTINEFYTLGQINNSTYETFLTWVENDLHKAGKSEKIAYSLISEVFRTLTTPVSYLSLAKSAGLVSHLAAQEYLDILEKMFVLFDLNALLVEQKRPDFKKNKKIYFTDPFIYNALYLKTHELMENPFGQSKLISSDNVPFLAENIVGAKLARQRHPLYWGKTANGEIDFAVKTADGFRFFEVKYREQIHYEEIFRADPLTVISKKHLTDKPFSTIPLELFLCKSQ